MSTFENDLRLEEIGTGERAGTWGTATNTNLELIANALSYSATGEAIANASTHTITMADGAADEFRSFYLKCTGGGQACTVTLAPNTLSKVWMIENTTSATLTFTQGSGANVAILAGQVKVIGTDGAGSAAVVHDLMQDLAVPDLFIDDDLTLQSDAAVLGFGADKDVTLTHVADTGLLLNAAMKVQFRDAAIFIGSSGVDVLDIASDGVINLTATTDVVIPANVGLTFGTGEKIEGDSTDLTVTSGADINLTATADVNIPSGVGLTFGDDGEKIEGDGTDLTISGNNINLTAVADIVVPADVGITFGTGEKIEGDNTDLTVTSGADINLTATADINIPADVGLTFGNDGEKIEGDGTDLTISGNNINLTAVADIIVPANVGLTFGTGEKIEGDSTDLTITSGAKINLTATSDVHIPNDVGMVFGDAGEKIEGDGTNLAINSSGDLNITATTVDLDGNLEVSGTTAQVGVLTTTATQVATGGITSGSNIVSDTDSTDDLGTTSVRWANLFVDGITATDQITATGFTGTLDGILGSGSAAAATVTTLDTSGVVNLNLVTDSTSSTSGALIVDGGVGIAKKLFVGTNLDVSGTLTVDGNTDLAAVEFDSLSGTGSVTITDILDEDNLASDSATKLATQQSIKAYVDANTGGTLSEVLSNGNRTTAAEKIEFRDAAIFINSSADGQLDLVADTEIQIAATTVDLNGNLDVSGTALVTGILTTTAATVFNGGFASNGASTISDDLSITGATPTFQMVDTDSSNNVMDFTYFETFLIDIDPNNARGSTAFQIDQDGTQAFKIDTSRNAAFAGTVTATGTSVFASLDISGDIDVDGTTNLDIVDIDGAVNMATTALVTGVLTTTAATVSNGGGQFNGAINVGVNDTGYDVKFFGDTASAYMQWDASTDDLILGGASTLGIGTASPLRQLHISNTSANSEIAFTAGTSGTSSLLFGDGLTGADVYKGYLQYQHNGDYMLLASAGATVVRLDSDGLKFGEDSAAANALSDYEEGAVSLTMTGANGNPSTTVNVTGTYVKIGRLVSVRAQNLNFNNTGAAGPINLTGFPFASNGAYGIGSIGEINDICTFTNTPFLVVSGTIGYVFENITQANAVAVNHHVDTAGAINIDVTYETNS